METKEMEQKMSKRKEPPSSSSHGSRWKNPRVETKPDTTTTKDPTSLPPRAVELARAEVEKKVKGGKTVVFRALKKGKGFERQKLGKRLKNAGASKQETTIKKLELEMSVLKDLDLNSLAETHILKTLFKTKSIHTSILFPPGLSLPAKEPEAGDLDEKEIAKRNVIARLYNSNPVKEAMEILMTSIRVTMGMVEEVEKKDTKWEIMEVDQKKPMQRIDIPLEEKVETTAEELGLEQGSDDSVGTLEGDGSVGGVVEYRDPGEEWSGEEEDEAEEEDGEATGTTTATAVDGDVWEGFSDAESDEFADFENRICGSSDEEEEEEEEEDTTSSKKQASEETQSISKKAKETNSSSSEPLSKPPKHPRRSPSPSPPPRKRQKPTKKEKSAAAAAASSSTSTFLPSLMGGYVSGSDSDPDADFYKDSNGNPCKGPRGPPEKKDRKNRMGQQARRALWQKKFGQHANHIKTEERKNQRSERFGRGAVVTEETNAPPKMKKKTELEGALHPSWEAKRKAKEAQAKIQASIMKPQGTKIVFD